MNQVWFATERACPQASSSATGSKKMAGKSPQRLGLIEPPDSWSAEQKTSVNGHQVSSALEGSHLERFMHGFAVRDSCNSAHNILHAKSFNHLPCPFSPQHQRVDHRPLYFPHNSGRRRRSFPCDWCYSACSPNQERLGDGEDGRWGQSDKPTRRHILEGLSLVQCVHLLTVFVRAMTN